MPTRSGPRFTLKQLGYFIAAAEMGTISGAAARLHISAPSISAAIAQLETELELQLFVRHHAQGLSLTSPGERFLLAARRLLQQADDLGAMAGDLSGAVAGPLSVGCLVTLAPILLAEICLGFATEHPRVAMSFFEGDQEELIERLRSAGISVALTYDLQLPDDIAFERLAVLPPCALLAASHPLAGRRSVRLAELAPEPLILIDLPLSRDYFGSLFIREGLAPNVRARSRHVDVVRSLVADGYGYSLVNVRPVNQEALSGKPLSCVPLAGNLAAMPVGLATARAVQPTRVVTAFVERCRRIVTSRAIPGMAPLGTGRRRGAGADSND